MPKVGDSTYSMYPWSQGSVWLALVSFIRTVPPISKPPDLSRMMGFPCLAGLGAAGREGCADGKKRNMKVKRENR
jgi:hypothetical protein